MCWLLEGSAKRTGECHNDKKKKVQTIVRKAAATEKKKEFLLTFECP